MATFSCLLLSINPRELTRLRLLLPATVGGFSSTFDLDEFLDAETGRAMAIPILETAVLKMEGKTAEIRPNTYLADSGASSHMGPGDERMFDLVDQHSMSSFHRNQSMLLPLGKECLDFNDASNEPL